MDVFGWSWSLATPGTARLLSCNEWKTTSEGFGVQVDVLLQPMVLGGNMLASIPTNYDGSQDEGDLQSDDVLANFLSPFSGSSFSDFRSVRLG